MNPMQRASLAALAVVLGACASSPAAGPARTPTTRAALEAASPVTVPDRRGIDSATWTAQPAPVIPASALAGRGAPVPFHTYEAEDMVFRGDLKGPSRKVTETAVEPAAEASGRMAVDLRFTGDSVEFSPAEATNSLVIRFALPDGNGGKGIRAPLELWVNDKHVRDITLTSEYSVVYGDFPWSNDASLGMPRHWFDEVPVMVDEIPAGATIRLQRPAANNAAFCLIDLVDTEEVPAPLVLPPGFLSVADFGAVPNDGKADNEAIERCQAAVKKQKAAGVWLPPGTWDLSEELYPDVVFRGAGMWYTVVKTPAVGFNAVGKPYEVHDLRIEGSTKFRDDSVPAGGFEGKAGKGSLIENVWVTHTKVGVWTSKGVDGLTVRGCRIRNTLADGVNLAYGAKNCVVENSSFRGTGDDSVAAWSTTEGAALPDENNSIRHNTIQCPWLASGIAIYGGKDTLVEGNLVADTGLNGAGIDLSVRFETHPFTGTVTVKDNTLVRSGSLDGDGGRHGALWLDGRGASGPGTIVVRNLDIFDATLAGLTIQGDGAFANVDIDHLTVDGASTWGAKVLDNAAGTLNLAHVRFAHTLSGGMKNTSGMTVNLGEGNEGL